MAIYFNQDLAPEWWENEMPSAHQEPVIGAYDNGYKDKVIERAIEEQNSRVRRLSGKERFKALCRKLGLHPSTIKDI